MRKLVSILAAVLAIAAGTAAYAHHGPAKVTIDAAARKQPAVTFQHDQHATTLVKPCEKCHHTNKGLTPDNVSTTKVEKCSVCHLDPKKPGTPSMREMSPQKNPFHIRCLGCHKELKKGPVVCKDCHKK